MKDLNETIEQYDLIVLGGGISGYTAAICANRMGKKTALIEGDGLGGVYLHTGCFATSYMIDKAKFIHECVKASQYGVSLGDLSVDLKKMLSERTDTINATVSKMHAELEKKGVHFYQGVGSVLPEHRMRVSRKDGSVTIIGWEKLLVATGSHAAVPKMYREVPGIMTSREVLSLTKRPDELIIIGGGFIACEVASIFSMFGTKITILNNTDQLISGIEKEGLARIETALKRKQVNIAYQSRVQDIYRDSAGNYHLEVQDEKGSVRTVTTQAVMIALGREANTIGLEGLGLAMKQNFIDVSPFLETSVKDVYAVGDVTATSHLSHTAQAMAYCAVYNMFSEEPKIMDYAKVKACLNTEPRMASVGLKVVSDTSVTGVSQSDKVFLTDESAETWMKLTADKAYGELLNAFVIGKDAFSIIAQAETAINLEGTVADLCRTGYGQPITDRRLFEAAKNLAESIEN